MNERAPGKVAEEGVRRRERSSCAGCGRLLRVRVCCTVKR
jgi:hypothetical protein